MRGMGDVSSPKVSSESPLVYIGIALLTKSEDT